MSFDAICMPAAIRAQESLSLATLALLDSAGQRSRYRDINAALGLSFTITAATVQGSVARWPAFARDANLLPAADLFGIRLRDLHPPHARRGLEQSREYREHFLDSYLPLIETALANGQPVIAFRGWPDPWSDHWGIITATSNDGLGLAGCTAGSDSMLALKEPALQCYVVEELAPRQPDDAALLRAAVGAARCFLYNRSDGEADVVTGPEAYDRWRIRLDADLRDPAGLEVAAAAHAAFASTIVANRAAAALFLGDRRASADDTFRNPLDEWLAACQAAGEALAPLCDVGAITAAAAGSPGIEELIAGLLRARSADQRARDCADTLASLVKADS